MDPTIIYFKNNTIEIHEHPIYHDFEYVIKNQDGKVMTASTRPYKIYENAERDAKDIVINELSPSKLWNCDLI